MMRTLGSGWLSSSGSGRTLMDYIEGCCKYYKFTKHISEIRCVSCGSEFKIKGE